MNTVGNVVPKIANCLTLNIKSVDSLKAKIAKIAASVFLYSTLYAGVAFAVSGFTCSATPIALVATIGAITSLTLVVLRLRKTTPPVKTNQPQTSPTSPKTNEPIQPSITPPINDTNAPKKSPEEKKLPQPSEPIITPSTSTDIAPVTNPVLQPSTSQPVGVTKKAPSNLNDLSFAARKMVFAYSPTKDKFDAVLPFDSLAETPNIFNVSCEESEMDALESEFKQESYIIGLKSRTISLPKPHVVAQTLVRLMSSLNYFFGERRDLFLSIGSADNKDEAIKIAKSFKEKLFTLRGKDKTNRKIAFQGFFRILNGIAENEATTQMSSRALAETIGPRIFPSENPTEQPHIINATQCFIDHFKTIFKEKMSG